MTSDVLERLRSLEDRGAAGERLFGRLEQAMSELARQVAALAAGLTAFSEASAVAAEREQRRRRVADWARQGVLVIVAAALGHFA